MKTPAGVELQKRRTALPAQLLSDPSAYSRGLPIYTSSRALSKQNDVLARRNSLLCLLLQESVIIWGHFDDSADRRENLERSGADGKDGSGGKPENDDQGSAIP